MNLAFDVYDIVGFAGAICIVGNYARVQWHRDYAKTLNYSVMNACAAVLMCISLSHHFNMSSMLINSFWFFISLYGVVRCIRHTRRDTRNKEVI